VLISPFKTKCYHLYDHGLHQISHLKKGVLYHKIDTVDHSGSPVLVKDIKGDHYAIAIHKVALKHKQVNAGSLLTGEKVEKL